MTDNEKAAIAAGLWQPCAIGECVSHNGPPPDMHLPENLWRALDAMDEWNAYRLSNGKQNWYLEKGDSTATRPELFDALVVLYDAEHPEQINADDGE